MTFNILGALFPPKSTPDPNLEAARKQLEACAKHVFASVDLGGHDFSVETIWKMSPDGEIEMISMREFYKPSLDDEPVTSTPNT